MFRVYPSNQTERLLEQLLHLLADEPLANPLRAEQILVQSPGMATWLKLQIAEHLGVAANLEFPLPSAFFWQLFCALLPQLPERSHFDKAILRWRLLRLLPAQLAKPEYAALKHYLAEDAEGLLGFQVSQKIADVFDGYLVYRPDWIDSWQRGEMPAELAGDASAVWQADLWRLLCADDGERPDDPHHRVSVQRRFIELLRSGQVPAEALPPRLLVFGISALPPQFLELMMALASRIDVHLLMLNPCQFYWGDLPGERTRQALIDRLKPGAATPLGPEEVDAYLEGNPLLASWGQLGRDYQALVYAHDEVQEADVDLFETPPSLGLLGHIQRDILQLSQSGGDLAHALTASDSRHKILLDASDQSLRVASAHSPMREMEALYDHLLGLFDDPRLGLKPREVVVMMPDVNRFAPFIQAVFGTAPAERRIPFAIADQSVRAENPALTALRSLLSLPLLRLGRSEVLDILEVPQVLRRFRLEEDDLPLVRNWLEEVGVRWGLDGAQRAQAVPDMPEGDFNTWSRGLERLLLGYAMGATDQLVAGTLPYAAIEGSSAQALGALCEFLAGLRPVLAASRQSRSLSAWVEFAQDLLHQFFEFVGDEENALRMQLLKTLEELQQEAAAARIDAAQPLSLAVFRSAWLGALEQMTGSQRFLAGRVNFCTLMPMRSIPFRVICLLGMNDNDYPRTVPRLGFDLLGERARQGDRSRRDDDRYLFLEALISARAMLYISYQGRDPRDNAERLPSVLVSELLEYCEQGFCLQEDAALAPTESAERLRHWLLREHRLQPFHPNYYKPASATGSRPSYVADWLPLLQPTTEPAEEDGGMQLALPQDWSRQIELRQLLEFFDNPCRAFLQQRLGIRFQAPQEQVPDVEPFALDGLQRFRLRADYLQALAQQQSPEQFQQRWQAQGELPPGAQGERLLQQETASVATLFERWQALIAMPQPARELDCLAQGWQVQHWFRDIYAVGRVKVQPSKLRGKHFLREWIAHVFFALTEPAEGRSWLLGLDGDQPQLARFEPLTLEQAQQQAQLLLQTYEQGLQQPLAMFPNSAWAWINAKDEQRDKEAAKAFHGNSFAGIPGEGEDSYIARLFPDWAAVQDELAANAQRLLTPLLGALVVGEDD